jgi:uncharacterized phage infection (PIP) family protein YhgE
MEKVKMNPEYHSDSVARVKELVDDYDFLESKLEDLKSSKAKIAKKLNILETERDSLKTEIFSLRQANSSLSTEMKETKENYQRTQKQLQTEKEKTSELESEIKRLTRMMVNTPRETTSHQHYPDDDRREDEHYLDLFPVHITPQKDREDEVSDIHIENIPKTVSTEPSDILYSSTDTISTGSIEIPKKKSKRTTTTKTTTKKNKTTTKRDRSKTTEKPKPKAKPSSTNKKRKITNTTTTKNTAPSKSIKKSHKKKTSGIRYCG